MYVFHHCFTISGPYSYSFQPASLPFNNRHAIRDGVGVAANTRWSCSERCILQRVKFHHLIRNYYLPSAYNFIYRTLALWNTLRKPVDSFRLQTNPFLFMLTILFQVNPVWFEVSIGIYRWHFSNLPKEFPINLSVSIS